MLGQTQNNKIICIGPSLVGITLLSSELCTLAVLKINNACCLTLAISHFILLSQLLFVPYLFENVYCEGKRLAESVHFQNRWGAQFAWKKCKCVPIYYQFELAFNCVLLLRYVDAWIKLNLFKSETKWAPRKNPYVYQIISLSIRK